MFLCGELINVNIHGVGEYIKKKLKFCMLALYQYITRTEGDLVVAPFRGKCDLIVAVVLRRV